MSNEKPELPKRAPKAEKKPVIVCLVGTMHHLFTNQVFDARGIEHEIDSFVQTQIDAGKLAVRED